MREPLYAFIWILILMAIIAFILLTAACGHQAPGDPFGYHRPEELVVICHVEAGDVPSTMTFNRSMAERHVHHHHLDSFGACYAPEL